MSMERSEYLRNVINKLRKDLRSSKEKLSIKLLSEQENTEKLRRRNETLKQSLYDDNARLTKEHEELKKRLAIAQHEKDVVVQSCQEQLKTELDVNRKLKILLKDLEKRLALVKTRAHPVIAEDRANPQGIDETRNELIKLKAQNGKLNEMLTIVKGENKLMETRLLKIVEESRSVQAKYKESQNKIIQIEDEIDEKTQKLIEITTPRKKAPSRNLPFSTNFRDVIYQ